MSYKVVATNTFYQILARGISSFVGFIITILIAGKYGVLGYGDFTKVISYVTFFYLFVDLGLNAIFLQNAQNKLKDIAGARLVIAVFVFAICNLVTLILPHNETTGSGFSNPLKFAIFIFSFTIFAQGIIYSALSYYQKNLNYKIYTLATAVGSLFNLGLVSLLVHLDFSLFYVFVSLLISYLITAIILFTFIKERLFGKIDFIFAKDLLFRSIPIALMLIFNFIYFRIDIFLLSILSAPSAVGIYGLAYKFFDFLITVPLFLSNALYPLLLSAKDNRKVFKGIFSKYLVIFLGLSIIIAIPFYFASPLFSLIKPEFIDSSVPFKILILSLPFFFLTCFLQWVLITLGNQKYLMGVYLATLIINIALNILFIPIYSYMASAFITFLTEGLVLLMLLFKIIQEREKIYG